MYRRPRATYRLQLNASFTFNEARRIVPYLADLGISDLYLSPILKARKGSAHGYDVVDAFALNPELGTDEDFAALQQEASSRGLGLLIDIVPNHMAASDENAWWMSVLENGPNSRYLHYFDIDWNPFTSRGQTVNKILLPILGKPYGEALDAREIQLAFDCDGFFFTYYDRRLPVAPHSYSRILRDTVDSLPKEGVGIELHDLVVGETNVPNSRFLKETLWRIYEQDRSFHDALDRNIARINGEVDALDDLLDRQWYRLAYWRIASQKINYRRFFDIVDLVGVRVENPEVFEARNRRIFELVQEGKITGLRIDHIDGLYDPIGYLRKLQLRLNEAGAPPATASDERRTISFYVVVEKILERCEDLPRDFPVSGTTGYDFLDTLNALFVDSDGLARLDAFYRSFTGLTKSFAEVCYDKKKQVIEELFSGEMRSLGKRLSGIAMADRNARDFAPVDLTAALTEVTACLDVYRTYLREGGPDDADRAALERALACARQHAGTSLDSRLFQFLELVLLMNPHPYLESERDNWLAFVMRWQQFTGRVMAKGVEDTAFYSYNRLLSLNEVGSDPGRDDFDGLKEFHERNRRVQSEWPGTLNATSTHDTKRSEDVRARISVLSEIPDAWTRHVRRWSRMNAHLRSNGVPDPNEELMLYQTLVGMWPLDEEERAGVRDRLKQFLEKAAREAKAHTSWVSPDAGYEKALLDFADALLNHQEFCGDFLKFQKRIAFYGAINALSQVVLKATSPGVPDFYQGSDLFDLSLVDPDNRRAVDYERRSMMLRKMKALGERLDLATLLRRWHDGRLKMFITWRLLDLRFRRGETFANGAYEPVDGGRNVCAFRRGGDVLVAVPRFVTEIVKPGVFPVGEVWSGNLSCSGRWRNVFSGDTIDTLPLARVFEKFPVAVLEKV
ncbi:MAG TPA: malto-oligosyltrehalose synthase [Thermoanaerobaculia bacterium]|nr:malto-oligosyltrehalose synthase [Thermoanaerobaculia bacterium]